MEEFSDLCGKIHVELLPMGEDYTAYRADYEKTAFLSMMLSGKKSRFCNSTER